MAAPADRDGPRDECGVFGIYAPDAEHEVSKLSYFALYALQHRGQESAGIATCDLGGHILTLRELGLVSQVFNEQKLQALAGDLAASVRALLDHGQQRLGRTRSRSTAAMRARSRSPITATSSTPCSCTAR